MPFAPEYLHLVFPGVHFEAFLYGRNSDDPHKTGGSVDDQLTTGRTLCHHHNWRIAQEFKDPDTSASRHTKKIRGDFEDLLTTIVTKPPPEDTRSIVAPRSEERQVGTQGVQKGRSWG